MLEINQEIQFLEGVGPKKAQALKKLNIFTIGDLLNYFPYRYDDYSNINVITKLKPGTVSLQAKIQSKGARYVGRRRQLHITEAIASDNSGSVRLLWYNQPYRKSAIKEETDYFISGIFKLSHGRLIIENPSIEEVSVFPISAGRITPIYRQNQDLKIWYFRKIIRATLQNCAIDEYLPLWLVQKYHLIDRSDAYKQIHFPKDLKSLDVARRRFSFEEIFSLILAHQLAKKEIYHLPAKVVKFDENLARRFVSHLGFKLTDDQRRVTWQIIKDLSNSHPMNRLVEGDTGSGKTVVAAMAAAMVIKAGYSVVLMAPTEVLAVQHFKTFINLYKPLKIDSKVHLLVGSKTLIERKIITESLKTDSAQLIIGTHAVLEDKFQLSNLVLAIVDEQHRFGVEQRNKLLKKVGYMPHMLSLSATPIPRSLALTLYGELDLSLIKQKPLNRLQTISQMVKTSQKSKLYDHMVKVLSAGQQIYVVCPYIDDQNEDIISLKKAYQEYSQKFTSNRVEMLHGRLPVKEKNQIMSDFVEGKINILISTTVIEVGVDVPNAILMIIEQPERFGLAQLHQLRGRVGRSDLQSYCYLVCSDDQPSWRRLQKFVATNDGFALAELDLAERGPGAIYGRLQSGLLDLKLAQLNDHKQLIDAKTAAEKFVSGGENLLNYPQLAVQIANLQKVTQLN